MNMIYDPVIMTIIGSGSVSQDTSTLLRHGTTCLRRWDLALWMSFRTQNWERIMVSLRVILSSGCLFSPSAGSFSGKSDAITDRGNLAFLFLNVGSTWVSWDGWVDQECLQDHLLDVDGIVRI